MNGLILDSSPEISIILCTYNRAKYLNNCIDSVLAQTIQNWELIVVDDGSQDNSFEVVDSYIQNFDNIRYLKHQNRKLWYARNVGVQASFGNYITFIDSDDRYKANHLESRLEYMKAHSEIDLIEGGFNTETEEEFWVADYFKPGQVINIRECVLGSTFFGKKQVFLQLNGYNNIAYGEDTDFWERAEKIFKTQKITEPKTYLYNTTTENTITKSFLETTSEAS